MKLIFTLSFTGIFLFFALACSSEHAPRARKESARNTSAVQGVIEGDPKNEENNMLPTVPQMKGFFLDQLRIPLEEIKDGGPPKDGIPSIDFPKFIEAKEATFLQAEDMVIGVVFQGIATAYPIRILNYHEVVNDKFGKQPVVVTYCPLCGSGVAFLAGEAGHEKIFGVSGLLYNSDVLLYDRTTESLWSQLMAKAISGPLSGTRLEMIPSEQTTWENWRKRYPQTMVMTTNTGHLRDYDRSPYQRYDQEEAIYFPVVATNDQLPKKEKVIGVEVNGRYKAYPFSKLAKQNRIVKDVVNGQHLFIEFDTDSYSARVTTEDGLLYPSTTLYWFAWYAFHPLTAVY